MRFWLARDSEVPIREQLVMQVVLGILSSDLQPGERLPSVRELARRFKVHPNTISAAYQELQEAGWLESRRGSGVYVCSKKPASSNPELALDGQIASLFAFARSQGLSLATLRRRLSRLLSVQPPDRFVVIEPDQDLRELVIAEIRQVVRLPVHGCDIEQCKEPLGLAGAIPVVLPSKAAMAGELASSGIETVVLQVRSIPSSLAQWLPAPADLLVGIASRWPEFLTSAHTMLVAAGFDRDSLVIRNTGTSGWERGLSATSAVVCDTLTAGKLPSGCHAIVFSLLSDESVEQLRRYEEFVTTTVL
jgi:GntR family transcriptional regulator